MFIRLIDEGLENMLRELLPLPGHLGEISFDPPTGTWAAQLSRLTVNLFLYDVARSAQPGRSPTVRAVDGGRAERRPPLPMVELSYLVSAWAGSPRDEHQLLGDVINRLAAVPRLDPRYLPAPVSSSVDLRFAPDPDNRLREIWGAVGGALKASFTIHLTVAADVFDWADEAPRVERIEALTRRIGVAPGR
jgi:hypothetical protein